MTPRALLLALAALAALPTLAPAGPSCGTGSNLMSWPTGSPVWELCWRRPANSTGPNGSGLEIHDVYYKGKLVFKRAHAPILNVQYLPGGCGGTSLCYRDWADEEVRFEANNEIFPGYAEPTTPPRTVCDVGTGTDLGTFLGVAAEKSPALILTTQYRAGWYRYTMKWQFEMNGTIRTSLGFSAVAAACVSYPHYHHNYWRLDFDIDGAAGDVVYEGSGGGRPRRFAVEDVRKKSDRLGAYWDVRDATSGRGYRILPGANEIAADAFGVADAWVLAYRASELDDTGQPGPACAVKLGNFVNGESVGNADVVFWYGGHAELHQANHLDDCHIVGPTLIPIGSW